MALLGILVVWPVVAARSLPTEDGPLYGTSIAGVEALAPAGIPVVVEDALSFLPLQFETRRPGRPYYFVLDGAPALDPRSSPRAPISYQGMTIWKQVGYLADRILPAGEFLPAHHRFIVLHARQFLWYETRLESNPAYTCRVLGKVGDSEVVLVEQRE